MWQTRLPPVSAGHLPTAQNQEIVQLVTSHKTAKFSFGTIKHKIIDRCIVYCVQSVSFVNKAFQLLDFVILGQASCITVFSPYAKLSCSQL